MRCCPPGPCVRQRTPRWQEYGSQAAARDYVKRFGVLDAEWSNSGASEFREMAQGAERAGNGLLDGTGGAAADFHHRDNGSNTDDDAQASKHGPHHVPSEREQRCS